MRDEALRGGGPSAAALAAALLSDTAPADVSSTAASAGTAAEAARRDHKHDLAPDSINGGEVNWPLLMDDGSVAAPSLAFAGSPGTGLHFASRLKLGFAGTAKLDIASNINPHASIRWDLTNTHDIGQSTVADSPRDIWSGRNITAGGDVDAAGGFRRTFQRRAQSPATTVTRILTVTGAAASFSESIIHCVRAGSVVGLALARDTSVENGLDEEYLLTVDRSTNGGATWAALGSGVLQVQITLGRVVTSFVKGTHVFAADDLLRLAVTNNGTDGGVADLVAEIDTEW